MSDGTLKCPATDVKISITTACYNSASFIDRLYRSLQRQTYRNFEWVVVDDRSTDDTAGILETLAPPGALGMRVYRLPLNSGGGVAFALAIQKSTTEIVVPIDHDDELLPDALEQIAQNWSLAADSASCGLMMRIADPSTHKLIGDPLAKGTHVRMSWLSNARPDISDASFAMKAADAKEIFSPETMEQVCLNGAPLGHMTRTKYFVAMGDEPVRFYHRDNPHSQTNAIRISRKTVSTYAWLLNLADRDYLRQPVRWLRHALALLRFSTSVHGDATTGIRLVSRRGIRALLFPLIPVARLINALRPPFQTLSFDPYPTERVANVADTHRGVLGQ